MAVLPVQAVAATGLNPTFTAVSSSDKFDNDGRTQLLVRNGGGAPINVTAAPALACNQGVVHAGVARAVPAGGERWFGPFDPAIFNDGNGQVTVAFSGTTTVTAAPVRFAKS